MSTSAQSGHLCDFSTLSPTPSLPDWTHEKFYIATHLRDLSDIPGFLRRAKSAYTLLGWMIAHTRPCGWIEVEVEALQEHIGETRQNVHRHIRLLQRLGVLAVEHTPLPGGGRRNRYWFMPVRHVAAVLAGAVQPVIEIVSEVAQGVRSAVEGAQTAVEDTCATAISLVEDVTKKAATIAEDVTKKAAAVASSVSQVLRPPIKNGTSSAPAPFISINSKRYTGGGGARARAREGSPRDGDGPPPPPVSISAATSRLADDAALRLGVDRGRSPQLWEHMAREADVLLRQYTDRSLDDWLACQAWDLSGYGLDYWRDKVYSPLRLVTTWLLWDCKGRPHAKPAERPGTAPPVRKRTLDRAEELHRESQRGFDETRPRQPCCGMFLDHGGHMFDCVHSPLYQQAPHDMDRCHEGEVVGERYEVVGAPAPRQRGAGARVRGGSR